MKRSLAALTAMLLMLVALTTGCATMMVTSEQSVGVSSSPSGARVFVDGEFRGSTPVILDLKRIDSHTVRVELDGYEPYEVAVSKNTSAWVFGNLIFGWLPGLAVDWSTGAMYKLSPESISADLLHFEEALHWFRLAAEQGYEVAQYNLGWAYATGRGVPRDIVRAHMWYDIAALHGNKNAENARDAIARSMRSKKRNGLCGNGGRSKSNEAVGFGRRPPERRA